MRKNPKNYALDDAQPIMNTNGVQPTCIDPIILFALIDLENLDD